MVSRKADNVSVSEYQCWSTGLKLLFYIYDPKTLQQISVQ